MGVARHPGAERLQVRQIPREGFRAHVNNLIASILGSRQSADSLPVADEPLDQVRADEPRTAGHKSFHAGVLQHMHVRCNAQEKPTPLRH